MAFALEDKDEFLKGKDGDESGEGISWQKPRHGGLEECS